MSLIKLRDGELAQLLGSAEHGECISGTYPASALHYHQTDPRTLRRLSEIRGVDVSGFDDDEIYEAWGQAIVPSQQHKGPNT